MDVGRKHLLAPCHPFLSVTCETIWTGIARDIRLLHILPRPKWKPEPHYTYKTKYYEAMDSDGGGGISAATAEKHHQLSNVGYIFMSTERRAPTETTRGTMNKKRRWSRLDGPGTVTEKREMLSVRRCLCVSVSVPVLYVNHLSVFLVNYVA